MRPPTAARTAAKPTKKRTNTSAIPSPSPRPAAPPQGAVTPEQQASAADHPAADEYSPIPITSIRVGERIRGDDLGPLQGLANSIHSLDIIKLSVIDQNRNLIAGHRTIEAAARDGKLLVPVIVRRVADDLERLELELADNLHHRPLRDPLRIGQALARLKARYEVLHPETRLGAAGGGKNGTGTRRKTRSPNGGDPVMPCFTDYTAARFGVSKTWVNDLLHLVSEEFPEASRQRIRETPVGGRKKVARQELNRFRRAKRSTTDLPEAMPPLDDDQLRRQWSTLVAQIGELLAAQIFASAELATLADQGVGGPADLEPIITQVRELLHNLEQTKEAFADDAEQSP